MTLLRVKMTKLIRMAGVVLRLLAMPICLNFQNVHVFRRTQIVVFKKISCGFVVFMRSRHVEFTGGDMSRARHDFLICVLRCRIGRLPG